MRPPFILIAAAALAACGGPDPVNDSANNTSQLPDINRSSPSPIGGAPAEGTPSGNSVAVAAGRIPAGLWGSWGLTPGDCTSTNGDTKGLLIIDADQLRFYESRAEPSANVQTSSDSISGDFAFAGEGQRWSRHVSLELRDGELVRTERDPIASFRYVRCR